jgi:hypothetical protein
VLSRIAKESKWLSTLATARKVEISAPAAHEDAVLLKDAADSGAASADAEIVTNINPTDSVGAIRKGDRTL